ISAFVLERLPPDAAVGVNCKDIRALFVPAPTGFIEGFVVVRVPPGTPLDVTDVITARPGAAGTTGEVSTLTVYEVNPTKTVARYQPLHWPDRLRSAQCRCKHSHVL